MIPLSPFVRLMNWLSYQNGSAYLLNAQSSFAGSETRGQIDLVSQYQYRSSPAVVARGTLAMFHWDATPVLPHVNTPVLIIVGQQDITTFPVRVSECNSQFQNRSCSASVPARIMACSSRTTNTMAPWRSLPPRA
jgi:pimeloyl-ACP methyl ester carboxylesterase